MSYKSLEDTIQEITSVEEAAQDLGTIHVIHHPTKGYRQKGGGYSKEINRKTKTFKSHDTAAKSDNVAVHRQHYTDKKTGKEMTSFHPSTNRGTRVHTVNTASGKVTKGDYLHHHQAKAAEKMGKKHANSANFPTRAGKTHLDDIPKHKRFDHATQKGHYVEDKDIESYNFYADYIKKTTFDPETSSVRSKLVEERGAPNSECCDAPLKNYNNGIGHCSDCGENAGPVKDEHKEAATDMKKKPASKTPKLEVEPTEIPEQKMRKCPVTGKMIPVDEKLHGDQHKLDHNKDMKITASDMKMVRKKGAVQGHPAEASDIDTSKNPKVALKTLKGGKEVEHTPTFATKNIEGGKEKKEAMSMAALKARRAANPVKPVQTTNIVRSKRGVGTLSRNSVDAEKRRNTMGEDTLQEGTFKVQVDGLPTMYIDGDSAGGIKAKLRKKFKDPKAVISIERITSSEKKKELRAKVAEGAMKRMATQDAEKERLSPKKAAGTGLDTFKKKVDKVEEISKKTATSYVNNANTDTYKQGMKSGMKLAHGDYSYGDADRKAKNRGIGTMRALQRIAGVKKTSESKDESVNEISSELAGKAYQASKDQTNYKKVTPTTAKKSDQGTKALAYHQRKALDPSHTGTTYKGSGTDVAADHKPSSEPARKTSGRRIADYKKQGIDVEEAKDTHVTKDGRTVKKGLWYYMNKRKKAGTSRPASAGTVSPEAMKKSQK